MDPRAQSSFARWKFAAQGVIGGWTVATLEALLVWAIEGSRIDRTAERILIPLVPFAVYGTLGALACALVRPTRAARTVAAVAALAFGAWLVRAHSSSALHDLFVHAALAVAAAAILGALLLRHAARFATAFVAAQAFVVAAGLVASYASDGADDAPIQIVRSEHAPAGRPSLVLVTWDTVRADTLPCFGGGGLDTPELDRLVAEGVLFDRFQAVAPYTGPAHASMLNGLYPIQHGQRGNGDPPPAAPAPRLSEICADAGYATGGFVSTYVLRRTYGFERGFERFDDRGVATRTERRLTQLAFGSALVRRFVPDEIGLRALHAPGDVTVARAIEWYQRQTAPTFLWAHFYDAHDPYQPSEPMRARALSRSGEGPHAVDARAQERLVLQRGEIEMLDARLGELRAALERRDPGLANTWIVLLADHGECFGEGGIVCAHHGSLHRATQHVVLAIRPPGSVKDWPRGRRVSEPASQVDLLPTLCEALGLPAPAGIAGTTLVPALRGEALPPRGFYMEAFQEELGSKRLQGWWQDGAKYVRAVDGVEQLLVEDGLGERDATRADPARLAALRAELDRFLSSVERAHTAPIVRSAQDQRALQQLGYTGD